MEEEKIKIYLKGNQSVEVQEPKVCLGDLMEIECSKQNIVSKVRSLSIIRFKEQGKKRVVISILKIVEKIHEEYPDAEIVNLGAADIIVTYEKEQKGKRWIELAKVGFIFAVTFVGSAFSIMTFNNDVDATKLFAQIYEQVTGEIKTGLTILELAYSFGIALGILMFFNHFGKKKFSVDPTPMEVEMRTYENEIQTTLIQMYDREEQELNVGKPNSSGIHRD